MTPRSCPVYAGPDPCLGNQGHTDEHWTLLGSVRLTWAGDEEWSRDTSGTRGRRA